MNRPMLGHEMQSFQHFNHIRTYHWCHKLDTMYKHTLALNYSQKAIPTDYYFAIFDWTIALSPFRTNAINHFNSQQMVSRWAAGNTIFRISIASQSFGTRNVSSAFSSKLFLILRFRQSISNIQFSEWERERNWIIDTLLSNINLKYRLNNPKRWF